jgi:uncharacterized DUF497 family protein
MDFEFYFDTDIGMPHTEKHGVSEQEIDEFFNDCKIFEYEREDNSFIAIGKLKSNRFLQVIYRKKPDNAYFIITAFDFENMEIINMIEEDEI